MNDPSPTEELADRFADLAPVAILTRLAMADNLKQTMADHRRRVNDGHRAMARAAGMEDIVTDSAAKAGDDMGDTIVARDIVMQAPPAPAPAPQAQPAAAAASGGSTLGKLAVGAALLTGGAGAAMVADRVLHAGDQRPAVVDTDTDTDTDTQHVFGIETR